MPGRGHGVGLGNSSLLLASVAEAKSVWLAEPGLPGTWVTSHLKREREREKKQAEKESGDITCAVTCMAGLGHTASALLHKSEGFLSNAVNDNLLEARMPSEFGPMSGIIYFSNLAGNYILAHDTLFPHKCHSIYM